MIEKKCYYCGKKDVVSNLIASINKPKFNEKTGKMTNPKPKYIHQDCFEFVTREKKELDELVEEIQKVTNLEVIPSFFYPFLQDLRNGTNLCARISTRKSKKGYRYVVIKKTCQICSDTIKNGIRHKQIKDAKGKLMYLYAVISNQIPAVDEKLRNKHFLKKQKEKKINNNQIEDRPLIDEEIKIEANVSKKPQFKWLEEETD